MLRAVLFDLDNTLVDRECAFRECLGSHFPQAAIRDELTRLDSGGYGDRAELFAAWSRHAATAMDQALFGQILARRIQPDRDLVATLQALSRTVKLGIISNGGSSTQRGKWSAAGLQHVIPANCVWVSEEVGFAKPDTRIFLMATQMLEEAPGDCLYIGDHEENDVRGALAAGMRARLVRNMLTSRLLNEIIKEERFS